MWKPGLERGQSGELMRWAEDHVEEGDIVWDLGANQGIFSICAAHQAGAAGGVVAFEPDPFLVSLLHRTKGACAAAEIAPVTVLPIAASAENSVEEFLIARTDRTLNPNVS